MQPDVILSSLRAKLSVPVVEGRDLVEVARRAVVPGPHMAMIAEAIASWAKTDSTWDKRFIALHLFGEFSRGNMRMECLHAMETRAPDAAPFLLRQAMRDAYRTTASVLCARSALNQWTHTGLRRYSDVRVRPSVAVACDVTFLLRAASLRASLEVVQTCEGVIRVESFADALCTAPALYLDVPRGCALALVTRLLADPMSVFDPSRISPAEMCLAEEIILLATMSSFCVSADWIHLARMRGCVERARVIAAMYLVNYDPTARVSAYPPMLPYTAADVADVRATRALRAALTVPMSHQMHPLPDRIVSILRVAETELRAQDVNAWYTDLCLRAG